MSLMRAFYVRPDDRRPYEFALVRPDSDNRLPTRNVGLAGKTFAILGCGSLGSKVATTVARSGARKFILSDADVLKLENLFETTSTPNKQVHRKRRSSLSA
ncbi:ThiF family adenylyltransferase [Burkholderia multivorans]|uniref:ThiF family adenylyltransferase n=1 Tax=Burkholderia multivorans TaxID=87883 RepID=UPI0021BF271D|nr:ThiF family adenylyltransferase [Burkholderia multivorans]